MKTVILLHNPQCSKSREALAYLKKKDINLVVREYLKEPLTKTELKELLQKLGISSLELIRKKEPLIKEQGLEFKTLEQGLKALVDFPRLMERPIAIAGKKAAIGRPIENLDEILKA